MAKITFKKHDPRLRKALEPLRKKKDKKMAETKYKKNPKGRKPQKLSKAAMDAYKKIGVKPKDFSKVKPSKEMLQTFKKYSKYKVPKAKPMKAVGVVAKKAYRKIGAKAIIKQTGKGIAKKLPYVGAALIARDVAKGMTKYVCKKSGGKWTDGKCVGAKRKSKAKDIYSPAVRDPISKR